MVRSRCSLTHPGCEQLQSCHNYLNSFRGGCRSNPALLACTPFNQCRPTLAIDSTGTAMRGVVDNDSNFRLQGLPTFVASDCRLKLRGCSEVRNHHKRNRLRLWELASLLEHALNVLPLSDNGFNVYENAKCD